MAISKCIYTYKRLSFFTIAAFVLLASCAANPQQSAFDPKTCFEKIPDSVKGLRIVSGPRTEKNIIRDMVPPICHGHALFRHMKSKGQDIKAGTVVFRVVVEYTGEVANAWIEETTIQSEVFLREVSDFIMDTDFVIWAGDDRDTVFLYPATFGH
jgi:hypothetical protein